MNPTKAIKRARCTIRQADSALKEAANALRKQPNTEEPAEQPPEFLSKAFNLPDDSSSFDGLAAAAAALRQNGPRIFKIGDEIEVRHRLGKLRFVVIGIDHDKVLDRDHTLTLLLTSMVLGSAFDAPDLAHPFGRNSYPLSTIRAMLNAEFLDGFTEADRQVMTPTEHRTYSFIEQEYIYSNDMVFLLSASEAGFEINGDDVRDEGRAYPYFKTGDESRQLADANGNARYWWLRSPDPWDGNHVRGVTPSGALNFNIANYGSAVAAVSVIG